ncbi:hypothetical protein BHM03_00062323, partial [Ensete ventricosum]
RRRCALRSTTALPRGGRRPCWLAVGGHPLRVRHGQPLMGWQPPLRAGRSRSPLAAFAPTGGHPLQVAGSPLAGGLGRSRLPLATSHGQPLLLVVLAVNADIVYPCIPDPDGEDGGQASSSLAVSTRWISAAKLLLSDLATLAQREGGE